MFGYILKLLVIILVLLLVYLPLRRPWREKTARAWIETSFMIFMAGLLVLTLQGQYQSPAAMINSALLRIKSGEGINLIPFRSISSFIRRFPSDISMVNLIGNVVMFLPWGFGLPLLWRKKQSILSVMLHSLALPLFIETCQLFIGRSVDIDDLILNFTGGCLGAVLYFAARKLMPELNKLAV